MSEMRPGMQLFACFSKHAPCCSDDSNSSPHHPGAMMSERPEFYFQVNRYSEDGWKIAACSPDYVPGMVVIAGDWTICPETAVSNEDAIACMEAFISEANAALDAIRNRQERWESHES